MSDVNIEYETKYLNMFRCLTLRVFRDYNFTIFLFGSRAEGNFQRGSDYDIGVRGLDEATFFRLKTLLADEVEESLIPYKADIINFDTVSETFRNIALRNTVLWKQS
jgi:predicted nucleotidyltransferase